MAEKISLPELTITIPFRKDSNDRLENILFVLDYINHHFNTNIMVYEDGTNPTEEVANYQGIKYIFNKNDFSQFHRTKILNIMAKMASTKVISNFDCDCIVTPEAFVDSYNYIMNDLYDVVYPYNGRFNECSRSKLSTLRENFDFYSVSESELNCLHPTSVGGIIFENREKFLEIGGENERFSGWGWEDGYRYSSFFKLGLRVHRTDNYLLHVEHFRGATSSPHHEDYQNNLMEYHKTLNMTREQLKEYLGI